MERRITPLDSRPLDRNTLKYIVCALMLLDHLLEICTVPGWLEYAIIFFSRLTAPVMAFFIAEGYAHTRNVGAYMGRLALFALLSALPFTYLTTGHILPIALTKSGMGEHIGFYIPALQRFLVFRRTGVLYTLLLGLVNIWVWDRWKAHPVWKLLITLISLWLAAFGDWDYWDILFCLTFYFLRKDRLSMWLTYGILCLTVVLGLRLFYNPFSPRFLYSYRNGGWWYIYRNPNWGTFLVIPFIELLYSGKKGSDKPIHKWFFYVFYPAHLTVLCILKAFL